MLNDSDKNWIAEQLAASERRTAERLEATETRLLAEFQRASDRMDRAPNTYSKIN